MIQHRYIFIEKGKSLASVVETESYVRNFTNNNCEMKSTHIYSAFDTRIIPGPKDIYNWLVGRSVARYDAVHAMELAVIKWRRVFDPLSVLLSRMQRISINK